jgi:hypothetical protein
MRQTKSSIAAAGSLSHLRDKHRMPVSPDQFEANDVTQIG